MDIWEPLVDRRGDGTCKWTSRHRFACASGDADAGIVG
jgi:hypothetical protein